MFPNMSSKWIISSGLGVLKLLSHAAIAAARQLCTTCKCKCHSITVKAVVTSWWDGQMSVPDEHDKHPDQTIPCSSMNDKF